MAKDELLPVCTMASLLRVFSVHVKKAMDGQYVVCLACSACLLTRSLLVCRRKSGRTSLLPPYTGLFGSCA